MLARKNIMIVLALSLLLTLTGFQMVHAKSQADAEKYFSQGLSLLQQGNALESIAYFKKAIENNPEYLQAYFYLGNACFSYGSSNQKRDYLSQAASCYKRVLIMSPQESRVFYYLAMTDVYLEDYEDAVIYYHLSLQPLPREKTAYYGLAYSYYQLGDNGRALEYSRKAAEIDPQYASPYYLTGVIYDKQNDRKTATEYYRKAAQLGDPTARKMLENTSDIPLYTADTVKPYEATDLSKKTNPSNSPNPKNTPTSESFEFAFKTFILWVPGGSYTVENYNQNTSTVYTSAGTTPKSSITVNRNGTYVWNSAWDGKIIQGRWVIKDGQLTILKGQEGKDWILEKGGGKYEDVFLKDGFTWYSGKAVTVRKQ